MNSLSSSQKFNLSATSVLNIVGSNKSKADCHCDRILDTIPAEQLIDFYKKIVNLGMGIIKTSHWPADCLLKITVADEVESIVFDPSDPDYIVGEKEDENSDKNIIDLKLSFIDENIDINNVNFNDQDLKRFLTQFYFTSSIGIGAERDEYCDMTNASSYMIVETALNAAKMALFMLQPHDHEMTGFFPETSMGEIEENISCMGVGFINDLWNKANVNYVLPSSILPEMTSDIAQQQMQLRILRDSIENNIKPGINKLILNNLIKPQDIQELIKNEESADSFLNVFRDTILANIKSLPDECNLDNRKNKLDQWITILADHNILSQSVINKKIEESLERVVDTMLAAIDPNQVRDANEDESSKAYFKYVMSCFFSHFEDFKDVDQKALFAMIQADKDTLSFRGIASQLVRTGACGELFGPWCDGIVDEMISLLGKPEIKSQWEVIAEALDNDGVYSEYRYNILNGIFKFEPIYKLSSKLGIFYTILQINSQFIEMCRQAQIEAENLRKETVDGLAEVKVPYKVLKNILLAYAKKNNISQEYIVKWLNSNADIINGEYVNITVARKNLNLLNKTFTDYAEHEVLSTALIEGTWESGSHEDNAEKKIFSQGGDRITVLPEAKKDEPWHAQVYEQLFASLEKIDSLFLGALMHIMPFKGSDALPIVKLQTSTPEQNVEKLWVDVQGKGIFINEYVQRIMLEIHTPTIYDNSQAYPVYLNKQLVPGVVLLRKSNGLSEDSILVDLFTRKSVHHHHHRHQNMAPSSIHKIRTSDLEPSIIPMWAHRIEQLQQMTPSGLKNRGIIPLNDKELQIDVSPKSAVDKRAIDDGLLACYSLEENDFWKTQYAYNDVGTALEFWKPLERWADRQSKEMNEVSREFQLIKKFTNKIFNIDDPMDDKNLVLTEKVLGINGLVVPGVVVLQGVHASAPQRKGTLLFDIVDQKWIKLKNLKKLTVKGSPEDLVMLEKWKNRVSVYDRVLEVQGRIKEKKVDTLEIHGVDDNKTGYTLTKADIENRVIQWLFAKNLLSTENQAPENILTQYVSGLRAMYPNEATLPINPSILNLVSALDSIKLSKVMDRLRDAPTLTHHALISEAAFRQLPAFLKKRGRNETFTIDEKTNFLKSDDIKIFDNALDAHQKMNSTISTSTPTPVKTAKPMTVRDVILAHILREKYGRGDAPDIKTKEDLAKWLTETSQDKSTLLDHFVQTIDLKALELQVVTEANQLIGKYQDDITYIKKLDATAILMNLVKTKETPAPVKKLLIDFLEGKIEARFMDLYYGIPDSLIMLGENENRYMFNIESGEYTHFPDRGENYEDTPYNPVELRDGVTYNNELNKEAQLKNLRTFVAKGVPLHVFHGLMRDTSPEGQRITRRKFLLWIGEDKKRFKFNKIGEVVGKQSTGNMVKDIQYYIHHPEEAKVSEQVETYEKFHGVDIGLMVAGFGCLALLWNPPAALACGIAVALGAIAKGSAGIHLYRKLQYSGKPEERDRAKWGLMMEGINVGTTLLSLGLSVPQCMSMLKPMQFLSRLKIKTNIKPTASAGPGEDFIKLFDPQAVDAFGKPQVMSPNKINYYRNRLTILQYKKNRWLKKLTPDQLKEYKQLKALKKDFAKYDKMLESNSKKMPSYMANQDLTPDQFDDLYHLVVYLKNKIEPLNHIETRILIYGSTKIEKYLAKHANNFFFLASTSIEKVSIDQIKDFLRLMDRITSVKRSGVARIPNTLYEKFIIELPKIKNTLNSKLLNVIDPDTIYPDGMQKTLTGFKVDRLLHELNQLKSKRRENLLGFMSNKQDSSRFKMLNKLENDLTQYKHVVRKQYTDISKYVSKTTTLTQEEFHNLYAYTHYLKTQAKSLSAADQALLNSGLVRLQTHIESELQKYLSMMNIDTLSSLSKNQIKSFQSFMRTTESITINKFLVIEETGQSIYEFLTEKMINLQNFRRVRIEPIYDPLNSNNAMPLSLKDIKNFLDAYKNMEKSFKQGALSGVALKNFYKLDKFMQKANSYEVMVANLSTKPLPPYADGSVFTRSQLNELRLIGEHLSETLELTNIGRLKLNKIIKIMNTTFKKHIKAISHLDGTPDELLNKHDILQLKQAYEAIEMYDNFLYLDEINKFTGLKTRISKIELMHSDINIRPEFKAKLEGLNKNGGYLIESPGTSNSKAGSSKVIKVQDDIELNNLPPEDAQKKLTSSDALNNIQKVTFDLPKESPSSSLRQVIHINTKSEIVKILKQTTKGANDNVLELIALNILRTSGGLFVTSHRFKVQQNTNAPTGDLKNTTGVIFQAEDPGEERIILKNADTPPDIETIVIEGADDDNIETLEPDYKLNDGSKPNKVDQRDKSRQSPADDDMIDIRDINNVVGSSTNAPDELHTLTPTSSTATTTNPKEIVGEPLVAKSASSRLKPFNFITEPINAMRQTLSSMLSST